MTTEHTVKAFSEELEHLSEELLRMGGLSEIQVIDAVSAVINGNSERCKIVASRNKEVDELQSYIEKQILRLLALRQPMASDLREVVAALKIASDLERIGDLAENISRRGLAMENLEQFLTRKNSAMPGLQRMARVVNLQLKTVLDAYSARSESEAIRVWQADDEVDEHYNSLFREFLTYMMEDPRTISMNAHLLFIAKNLERIGDHATNIAEEVYFLATGNRICDTP